MMSLNAETGKRDNNGSERQNWKCDSEPQSGKWWQLWIPKLRSDNDGSESHKLRMQLWMPKLRNDGGSERQTKKWLWTSSWKCDMMTLSVVNHEWMVALNVKLRGDQRLWMPKWNNASECQNEITALNAKPKETMMNANLKQKLWTS